MSTLSKVEIRHMLARYDGLKHNDVFGSGWNQDLVIKSYKDCPLTITKDSLASEDVTTVYLAVNSHCKMFSDLTGLSDRYVATYIRNKGLLEYIGECMDIKKSLIEANVSPDETFSLDKVLIPRGHPVTYILRNTKGVSPDVFTFLNWLKRTPFKNLNFKDYCVDKFLKNQDRLGSLLSRTGSSYKLITQALAHIANCLLYGVKVSFDSFVLPPGQYLENLGKDYSYLKKWQQLSKYSNELPASWKSYMDSCPVSLPIPDYNHLLIVPKDYKTGRTICVESIWRTVMGYCMAEPLTRRLNRRDSGNLPYGTIRNENGYKEYFPTGGAYYNYQRGNQLMALLGSNPARNAINVATMDCSMASDSVTQKVCQDILPYSVYQWGEKCRSMYVDIGKGSKKLRKVVTWMTMGHPMTYPVESIIFFTAAVLATCLTFNIPVESLKPKNKLLDLPWSDPHFAVIQTAGDDVTLASECVEAFTFILQTLGFIVNADKSYWGSSYYRESCGKEYYCYHDVTGLYYPRGTSTNEFAELIGLQHKLAEYPQANAFIIDEIYKMRQSTTCSAYDSEYTDIWVPGIGAERKMSRKPRQIKLKSYDEKGYLDKIVTDSGRKPEEYKYVGTSVEVAMYGDSRKVVSNLDDVREVRFTYSGKLDLAVTGDDVISDKIRMDSPVVINYKIEFSIFSNLGNLTKYIHNSQGWRGDFLQTKLSSAEVETLFNKYSYTFGKVVPQLYTTSILTEGEEQNDYLIHTGIVTKYPNRSAREIMEAQKCAYMLALSRTHSHEEKLPWTDPTRLLDRDNLIDSILGSCQTDVKEKDILF